MRVSHFCEAEPAQPGTTRRTGPPWMFGSGWPFIAHTIMVCGSIAFDRRTPREMVGLAASPDRCRSAA
jgi:hypothetical protein